MRPIFNGFLLSRSTEFIKVFYNYGTDVPDACCIRRRLLLLAACGLTLNHATVGGFYAVKTVHGIINVNRGREQHHV
jgi:hypothetical protein